MKLRSRHENVFDNLLISSPWPSRLFCNFASTALTTRISHRVLYRERYSYIQLYMDIVHFMFESEWSSLVHTSSYLFVIITIVVIVWINTLFTRPLLPNSTHSFLFVSYCNCLCAWTMNAVRKCVYILSDLSFCFRYTYSDRAKCLVSSAHNSTVHT